LGTLGIHRALIAKKLTIQVDEFAGIVNSKPTEVRPMSKKVAAFKSLMTDLQPEV